MKTPPHDALEQLGAEIAHAIGHKRGAPAPVFFIQRGGVFAFCLNRFGGQVIAHADTAAGLLAVGAGFLDGLRFA